LPTRKVNIKGKPGESRRRKAIGPFLGGWQPVANCSNDCPTFYVGLFIFHFSEYFLEDAWMGTIRRRLNRNLFIGGQVGMDFENHKKEI
jgi:hypothetical protein